jgi:hypothetical protein
MSADHDGASGPRPLAAALQNLAEYLGCIEGLPPPAENWSCFPGGPPQPAFPNCEPEFNAVLYCLYGY